MQLTSIGVLTYWYGNYPWYFPYYVHSCSFNPTIDFYIMTDNLDEIPNKPDNFNHCLQDNAGNKNIDD